MKRYLFIRRNVRLCCRCQASKAILESLLSIVGITIDMTNLEKRAKDTEMLIQTVEQQVSGRALESQQPTTPGKGAH